MSRAYEFEVYLAVKSEHLFRVFLAEDDEMAALAIAEDALKNRTGKLINRTITATGVVSKEEVELQGITS